MRDTIIRVHMLRLAIVVVLFAHTLAVPMPHGEPPASSARAELLAPNTQSTPSPAITVYREAHYETHITTDVVYATTLVNCTDVTDQTTCKEAPAQLNVLQPADSSAGPYPIVISVHGGSYIWGDYSEPQLPPTEYFAKRGFVVFCIGYRLKKDRGLHPAALDSWSSKTVQPAQGELAGDWRPSQEVMYPAVRDIKAALRWIHANAHLYNGDTSSITIQGGSAGATAALELALTGGAAAAQTFAGDYTDELTGLDRTLPSTNLDQPAIVHGFIDFWGAIFAEDLMRFKDGRTRYSTSSVPTVAFHGTVDSTVDPETGAMLCGNLSALGVPCENVMLPDQAHGCWTATMPRPGGGNMSIIDYALEAMARMSKWTLLPSGDEANAAESMWTGSTCCDRGTVCAAVDASLMSDLTLLPSVDDANDACAALGHPCGAAAEFGATCCGGGAKCVNANAA